VIGDILQPTHLLFVLVVALLVLGPKRLPEVGRALGRGLRDFRNALSGEETHEPTLPQDSQTSTPSSVPEPGPGASAEGSEPSAATEPHPTQPQEPMDSREPVGSSASPPPKA